MLPPTNKQPNRGDFATDAGYRKAHYAANRDAIKAQVNRHYAENSARKNAAVDVRRGRLYKSASSQTNEVWKEIRNKYAEARRKTEETGILHSVDHVWPLNGRYSCGLHVPANLQVIPSSENDAKGNREPFLWWQDAKEIDGELVSEESSGA